MIQLESNPLKLMFVEELCGRPQRVLEQKDQDRNKEKIP